MLADCERIVQESIDGLGGLDIIINNAVRPICLSTGTVSISSLCNQTLKYIT